MSEEREPGPELGDLSLAPELRARLGLGPEERVRLLQANLRTVLLERRDGPAALELPDDCNLALVADVAVFPLADVLGLVHGSRRSGLLFFAQDDHAKAVYLRAGEVVFATSNQPVDRIGSCLVRSGAINLEQLREAERHFSPPDRFGKVLVERGYLTPRELWNGVKNQVEEIVRSLFSHTSGRVHFWDGEVQPDNVVRLALPTNRLVEEGLERRDELMRLLAVLENARIRLEVVPGRDENLPGAERRLFRALRAEGSFPAACRELNLEPLAAARTVQFLRLLGAVRMLRGDGARESRDPDDLRRVEDEALRQCVRDHVKLLGELVVPLVAVEGAAPVRERVARVLEELARRFQGLLEGVSPGPAGIPDPEELARRALGLPCAREDQVRGALGELVSYLEFELKNHPRIEDPDRFLGAIESLRAGLAI